MVIKNIVAGGVKVAFLLMFFIVAGCDNKANSLLKGNTLRQLQNSKRH